MVRPALDRIGEMDMLAQVVATGSFSAAARALRLTPSGVSRAIGRLEKRLGVRLLIRTTRTITLTPEGQSYHRAALRILRDLDETETQVADQATPRGRLRVSVAFSFGRLRIVPLLKEFLAAYPDILIEVSLEDTLVDLAQGQADVAIRVGMLPNSNLISRRLGDSGRSVVASPAYLQTHGTPKHPRELLTHNCLGLNVRRTATDWPFAENDETFVVPVHGNVETNNGDTLVQLALDGVGIARVGTFHVAEDLAAGRLVKLLDSFNPGDREPFHALFVGGETMPARIRAFVDYLAQRFDRS